MATRKSMTLPVVLTFIITLTSASYTVVLSHTTSVCLIVANK